MYLIFLFLAVFCFGCQPDREIQPKKNPHQLTEYPLASPWNSKYGEYSSLYMQNDTLYLLPENPETFSQNRILFVLKDSLRNPYKAIRPQSILLQGRWDHIIEGYEGLEAFLVHKNRAYALIEAKENGRMKSRLIRGYLERGTNTLQWDIKRYAPVPVVDTLRNLSAETLTLYKDTLYVIPEANGRNITPMPRAFKYDLNLNPAGSIPFPNIEYRITDATKCTEDGLFWVSNYYYPGEKKLIRPAPENNLIPVQSPPADNRAVERLIRLRITQRAIVIEQPRTISLMSNEKAGRNWEGLARSANGFWLTTDMYPRTIFAHLDTTGLVSSGKSDK